ncbi:hypothetical protein LCM14_14330 [Priestia aryabhattai]|uniref:hypothetical protein n=1 Tax=Priestia aryabhattai TaxID=412384 RepID=UPI001CD317DC|nr:hypothetical protein [Priestia aryabhattai]MCA1050991.1 hypothetical protein [Priestia aryabhattai]
MDNDIIVVESLDGALSFFKEIGSSLEGRATVEDIEEMMSRLTRCGVHLVGEVAQYKDSYRLCYIRRVKELLIDSAEQLRNK